MEDIIESDPNWKNLPIDERVGILLKKIAQSVTGENALFAQSCPDIPTVEQLISLIESIDIN